MMSDRKPHSRNLGYVSERKCKAECGGHIVIYDRNAGYDCDADERWIVQHEPSGCHVAVKSKKDAYDVMRDGELFPVETFGVTMADLMPLSGDWLRDESVRALRGE